MYNYCSVTVWKNLLWHTLPSHIIIDDEISFEPLYSGTKSYLNNVWTQEAEETMYRTITIFTDYTHYFL